MHCTPALTLDAALADQRRRLLAAARRYIAIAMAFADPAAAAQMIDHAAALLDRAREVSLRAFEQDGAAQARFV